MKTQMDLLTKHLLSGKTKKVKVVVSQERDESDSEKEANCLNNQGGFEAMPKETKAVASGSGKMSMEDMMAKLLKGVEATNMGITEVGTLPSDTLQNPRNDGSCMAITTRSGKVLENSSKGKQVVDNTEENVIDADCDDSVEVENQNKSVYEKTIPLPPPPFPQRLKKKADDTRFSKFMTI
ncbi:hypothetical protein CQW23_01624 [Capsicum baccatum]|uniref:Uncharacterized protein n=1 Tax=Capsicum baccatum TaxID=33114 RepID=A0A2G2XPI3_CAPBA|nr:hypothetical protein CQW23_01624 [Capsicum baccatum]